MAVFKKRETLTENIAYMALMAAINVVFVLISSLVPVLVFLLIFILPLSSTIVTIYCKKKYYIVYALATLVLCFLVSFWDIGNTLFYVFPSLISGFIFGLLIEKGWNPILIVLIAVISQVLLSYPSIPLIQLMYGRSIIEDFASIFGLKSFAYLNYVKHMFIVSLALMQQTISFLIVNEELPKLSYKEQENKRSDIIVLIGIPFFIALSVVMGFVFPELSYSFMFGAILLSIYEMGEIILSKNKLFIILLGVSLLLFIFLFAIFYSLMEGAGLKPQGLLLINILPLFVGIIAFINNYLSRNVNKDRMNIEQ